MHKSLEIIKHTSDIGLRVRSRTLKGLFKNGAIGLYKIMFDQARFSGTKEETIELEAETLAELFRSYLAELLYIFYVKGKIFSRFDITISKDLKLQAKMFGEYFNRERHKARCEIKAVTYYKLSVKRIRNFWIANVIFDV
jgi:SHS2 domain-containing protein